MHATTDKKHGYRDLNFVESFMMGGTAAAVSKTVAAPLERVKLLIQNQDEMIKQGSLDKPYKGFIDCTYRTFKDEGVLPFWRGNTANVVRYFPTQALNFSIIGRLRNYFPNKESDTILSKLGKNVVSGGIAGSTSLLFVYSLDYARTRLANDTVSATLGNERKFKGLSDVYIKTMKTDGIRGLYRGFCISCAGIFVYRGIYFGLYNTASPIINKNKSNFIVSFLLAYLVTVLGETVTYPIDTIRRRIMMTSGEQSKYKNSLHCAKEIFVNEGIKSFFKGAGANILRGFAGALLLSSYDKLVQFYLFFVP